VHAANTTPEEGVNDLFSVRQADDGVIEQLYYRECDGQYQGVWVRQVSAQELAIAAVDDLVREQLAPPELVMSPDATVGGYVNLETWLAVRDPGPITATAAIPGLRSTVSARAESVRWQMGTTDGAFSCDGLGVAWTPDTPADTPAPCGYTYRQAGAAEYGSEPYTVTATIVYRITWAATNGQNGDLGTTDGPTTTITYTVREIQTIGHHG
jgi:hypothetical protein